MTGIVEDIRSVLHQAGIAGDGDPGSPLRRGWDYRVPLAERKAAVRAPGPEAAGRRGPTEPHTDGSGVARLSHWGLLKGMPLPVGCLPVLDLDMDVRHLLAGIWRQCLIRPADDDAAAEGDPFLVGRIGRLCASSHYLMALIGHPPRDLALWFDDLRRRDRALFRLVLAKDFRTAMASAPDIVTSPWPSAVTEHWTGANHDHLPPFLVAVLYAELARLAMNQAGLLDLSFDGRVELTTRQLLDRVWVSGGPGASRAADRAIAQAPFQSHALGLPDALFARGNRNGIAAWVKSAAASIALEAGQRGGLDIQPHTPEQAAFLGRGFAAHPQYLPETRNRKGQSLQPRKAASFWGLGWRANGAVRLLELTITARAWNRRYRPDGPELPDATRYRTANPVARAIAAIGFRWVAEHDPAAGLTVLGGILSKQDKAELRFETWTPAMIDPLIVDDHLGDKSGLTMLEDAWKDYRNLPPSGAFGYTARSQAHLWLDDKGDDLAHYRRFQADAVGGHAAALAGHLPAEMARVPPEIVALLGRQHRITPRHGSIGHNQPLEEMTGDPDAARAAQLLGQGISPLSTDPVHARLRRGR